MSERPEHQRPRRLVDWLNPTVRRRVHSLILPSVLIARGRLRGKRSAGKPHVPFERRTEASARGARLLRPDTGQERRMVTANPESPARRGRLLEHGLGTVALFRFTGPRTTRPTPCFDEKHG